MLNQTKLKHLIASMEKRATTLRESSRALSEGWGKTTEANIIRESATAISTWAAILKDEVGNAKE